MTDVNVDNDYQTKFVFKDVEYLSITNFKYESSSNSKIGYNPFQFLYNDATLYTQLVLELNNISFKNYFFANNYLIPVGK